MQRGPKGQPDTSPLPFRSRAKGANRFAAFCRQFLRTPKGIGVGEPMALRRWQVEMMRPILDPDPRPSVAGIMLPRGNGKTSLMAALGLYELFTGPDGNEIPIVAVDERQATLTLRPAQRMVELNPELASRCQVYRDRIVIPATGATLTALPAEAKRLEGLGTWTLALADEVGVIDQQTWQTLLLGLGKLPGATAIGIGTPPNSDTSVLHDLRRYARERPDDDSFAWVEFSADEHREHPVDCRHCWRLANPALGDFLGEDSMRALLPPKTLEGSYRRARLTQFVSENEAPFISPDVWDSLGVGHGIADGSPVVLALDGSVGGRFSDTTALLLGTVAPTPHLHPLAVWESNGRDDYRVPILEVEQAIRDAAQRFRLIELVADPFRWQRSLEVLRNDGINVCEFPHSPTRLTAATTDLFRACHNNGLTHSSDPVLRQHILNATVSESDNGLKLSKISRSRQAGKIDLASCTIMAVSRATWLSLHRKKPARIMSFPR